jgi:chemotaxis protein methyltransferase CheR
MSVPAIVVHAVDREFDYTERDFERVRKLIYGHCGISLSPSKSEMVYSRLARRLRLNRLQAFSAYIDLLERTDRGGEEWQAFVNALTTNLTSFFREPHHFPVLVDHVRSLGRRQITLWSCAASTGEEAYSMAMAMCEHFGTWTPPVKILATDVDTNVLETARRGVYPMERLEKMSQERIKRFFMRGSGANAGMAKVRDELREMIVFRPANLLEPVWSVRGPLDAIFCRNVMIYFDRETQLSILKKLAPLMSGGGLLFAGHSENFAFAADVVKLRDKTVYEIAPEAKRLALASARGASR